MTYALTYAAIVHPPFHQEETALQDMEERTDMNQMLYMNRVARLLKVGECSGMALAAHWPPAMGARVSAVCCFDHHR